MTAGNWAALIPAITALVVAVGGVIGLFIHKNSANHTTPAGKNDSGNSPGA